MLTKEQINCRICRSSGLRPVINLGAQPLANGFRPKGDARTEERIPLCVCFCADCGLCQLSHVVSPEALFRNDYVYFSGKMPSALAHFGAYAEEVARDYLLPSDLVLEIGSNDGVLLQEFLKRGFSVLGVDPALNVAEEANRRGIPTLPEFFSASLARGICRDGGLPKVIIGNNVVAHIDDHHDLMEGVRELLGERGVFIFEAPHLADMFENGAFDSIYHEHLSYLALRPLKRLLSGYGLEIFKVKRVPVQGVSLRVYAARRGAYGVEESVAKCEGFEEGLGLYRESAYNELFLKILAIKEKITRFLGTLKENGKRVAVYGAPARGNVLLNFLSLPAGTFEYATEELPSKIGLQTPGTRISVVPIEEARKNPPDCFLALAWNYRDAILKKERDFLKGGGIFVFPVGEPMVVRQF